MCGICGYVYADRDRPVDRTVLTAMNETIRHRGPDSEGFRAEANVGLAMRRLAIIDLDTGNQPMANEDQTLWTVYNGEIYNFKELRRDLQSRGHVFRTRSDTEVIVHLYEEYGTDCVSHLRGMFAFALWDETRRQLFLARDRLGQKPLYYAEHDGALLFGSELKCILRYPGVPREADLEAIHHYLTLQYVPDPLSAFRGIHKLPPAHRLTWSRGKTAVERYWDVAYEPKWEASSEELRDRLRQLVREAVEMRMVSDVPLGAHLSGGIDSSIVVALMAEASSSPVKTFSIGFQEDSFSELPYAREVADRYGTEHQEFTLKPDALEILSKLVAHFDEPLADPAAIPTWYLAQMTRQHVTVALNGDGGDEAFAGYQRYYADRVADAYRCVPAFLRRGAIDPLLRRLPVQTDRPLERNWAMALRRIGQAAATPRGASIVGWGSYFSEADKWCLYTPEMRESLTRNATTTWLDEVYRGSGTSSRLDATLYTDLHTYLPGALLPKVDRMTMAHSLEARSPFLDHEVVEFAARLPRRWKVRGRTTKRLLRETFRDLLPGSLATRQKMGFGLPLGEWMRGALGDAAEEMLLASDARTRSCFSSDVLRHLFDEHRKRRSDHGKRILSLVMLETWVRQLGVSLL